MERGGADRQPRPPGQLAARRRGPPDQLGHRAEGKPEDVMQEERGPLGWREPVDHNGQRPAHLVIEGQPVRRISALLSGLRRLRGHGRPAGVGRAEPVQAQPAGHHHQPSPDVLDLIDAGSRQPGERLLHHVLGLSRPAQHPGGDCEQIRPVGLPGSLNPRLSR